MLNRRILENIGKMKMRLTTHKTENLFSIIPTFMLRRVGILFCARYQKYTFEIIMDMNFKLCIY